MPWEGRYWGDVTGCVTEISDVHVSFNEFTTDRFQLELRHGQLVLSLLPVERGRRYTYISAPSRSYHFTWSDPFATKNESPEIENLQSTTYSFPPISRVSNLLFPPSFLVWGKWEWDLLGDRVSIRMNGKVWNPISFHRNPKFLNHNHNFQWLI